MVSIKIVLQEADLAITDLTITAEREGAVDFTMPFMNLGISLRYISFKIFGVFKVRTDRFRKLKTRKSWKIASKISFRVYD